MSGVVIDPLTALQMSTVTAIKTRLPMLKSCEPHYGRFTSEDLQSFRTKTPAVHVSLPGVRDVKSVGSGLVSVDVKTVAVLITSDSVFEAPDGGARQKYTKEQAAFALVSSLLIGLKKFTLGAGVSPCAGIEVDNLTTIKAYKGEGVAVWGLNWTNTLTISDAETEAVLTALCISHAPKIGVPHKDEYKPLLPRENGAA